MNLPKNNNLKSNAQNLRKNMTREERHLWHDFLKTYTLQFNRQKVIGNYIIDFYCDKAKLAIEIDGSQHYEDNKIIYDKERTEYLNVLGLKVLRFTNIDIDKNFNGVCETIDIIVKERAGSPSSVIPDKSVCHLPQGEGL
jgi:very-short-patch-repair endonuclease